MGHGRHGRDGSLTRVGGGWPAGLPVPLTGFVGRELERAEVARLVTRSRLVTLTGAGGVGKTRLAVEVAAGLAADFGDGANLVDLSAVSDPALLPGVVAGGLGVDERAGVGLDERLVRVLREQHRLLVLDNCEHLRGACADLAAGLLGSCSGVVVLATSRATSARSRSRPTNAVSGTGRPTGQPPARVKYPSQARRPCPHPSRP